MRQVLLESVKVLSLHLFYWLERQMAAGVFNKTLDEHVSHLKLVLNVLLKNQLFAKMSKCVFWCHEVEYLGFSISGNRARIDPRKIEAMQNWLTPTSIKALRGFLRLTGYYRKFIKDYGVIDAPFTALLKKDSFHWSLDADLAFNVLKHAVSNPPVLALPDFSKPFVVECNASGYGLGAVLMQDNRPLAFHSEALIGRCLHLSTYEKELLALVKAIKK